MIITNNIYFFVIGNICQIYVIISTKKATVLFMNVIIRPVNTNDVTKHWYFKGKAIRYIICRIAQYNRFFVIIMYPSHLH